MQPQLPEPLPTSTPPEPDSIAQYGAHVKSVPELHMWGIRRSIAVAVAIGTTSVAALTIGALWYAHFPTLKRESVITASNLFDLLKLAFAVVAGIGGVAALVVAYRRQRVAEHTSKLAEFSNHLANMADGRAEAAKLLAQLADERARLESDRNGVRLLNERFAKASEQLGSERAAIRLAGVYAMAGLADDWIDDRQTCIDVLCAYMRMPYTSPLSLEEGSDQGTLAKLHEERQVRLTVIRAIARRLHLDARVSWQRSRFDLTGAVFDGGDFSGSHFATGTEVIFRQSTFIGEGIDLVDATLAGGILDFKRAAFISGFHNFTPKSMTEGRLDFTSTKIRGAHLFFSSKFESGIVDFSNSNIQSGIVEIGDPWAEETLLTGTEFRFRFFTLRGGTVSFCGALAGADADFAGANLKGGKVDFSYCRLNNGTVSFRGAQFAGAEVTFEDATFAGGVVDFTKPSAREFRQPPTLPTSEGSPLPGLILPESGWPASADA